MSSMEEEAARIVEWGLRHEPTIPVEDEQEPEPGPIDICPKCGAMALVAYCSVITSYDVSNNGEGTQDWERREVYDDGSIPESFECAACGAEWRQGSFELDDKGSLVKLIG